MNCFEFLEDEAVAGGIDVLIEPLPVPDMTAAYYRSRSGKARILLAPATLTQKTCDLAEELGHHCTGGDRVLRYNTPEDWRAEARARKWAHDRLLSPDAIRTAIANAADVYDLAEALGVTDQFLQEAMDDYEARGLWARTAGELERE